MNRVQGSFITGRPIRKQQKAEAVLSPGGGVGGRCRAMGCVLFLGSRCRNRNPGGRVGVWAGVGSPREPGFGDVSRSRRMCRDRRRAPREAGWRRMAFTACLFWCGTHLDKISF